MKVYKLSAAVAKVEEHGFARPHLREEDESANRLVTIHQDWTPKGKEKAVFRLARGKYRGQNIAVAYRQEGP
jgi:hypothetical protein